MRQTGPLVLQRQLQGLARDLARIALRPHRAERVHPGVVLRPQLGRVFVQCRQQSPLSAQPLGSISKTLAEQLPCERCVASASDRREIAVQTGELVQVGEGRSGR